MTNFLPYAIIAGIVIVFFVVCYVLYSGGNHEEEVKKEKPRTKVPENNTSDFSDRAEINYMFMWKEI